MATRKREPLSKEALGLMLDRVELFAPSVQISWSARGHSGPGFYAHSEEYPDEGIHWLTEDRDELAALTAELANRLHQAREGEL